MSNNVYSTLLLALGLIAILGLSKHLGYLEIGAVAALLYQLYIPVWLANRQGLTLEQYGIHWGNLTRSIKQASICCLLTFPPYIYFYHLFQHETASFNLLSSDIAYVFVTNLIVVALPEEIFYRGFIQTRFLRNFSPVIAILVTNLLFALGHFVGEYQIARLATFFPGIVFSFLTYKSGSITSAVLYHSLCNTLSEILHRIYMHQ